MNFMNSFSLIGKRLLILATIRLFRRGISLDKHGDRNLELFPARTRNVELNLLRWLCLVNVIFLKKPCFCVCVLCLWGKQLLIFWLISDVREILDIFGVAECEDMDIIHTAYLTMVIVDIWHVIFLIYLIFWKMVGPRWTPRSSGLWSSCK